MPLLLLTLSLLLTSCSTALVQANSAWTWQGVEVMGQHQRSREQVLELLPIRAGDPYLEDINQWNAWCAEIKAKLGLPYTNCSSVRYANNAAFFVVDLVEPGEESRFVFRAPPAGNVALASPAVLEVYEKLYARLMALFEQGQPPQENWAKGYLDFSDPEMSALAQELARIVPPLRENLLDVLAHDKDVNKREKAANLLNWTKRKLRRSVLAANRGLDDPSDLVRNNISRFTMHFVDKLKRSADQQLVIDQLLRQLNRPAFSDRNKSLYNLLFLLQKFPQEAAYVKSKGEPLLRYVAEHSILENVQGPAAQILQLLPQK